MVHRFVLTTCAVAALTAAAVAQTSPPSQPPASAPPAASSGTAAPQTGTASSPSGQAAPAQGAQPGLRTVNPATIRMTFYTVQPTDMPVSNLLELDVYNLQNEDIGEIEDVIVDNGKTIKAIVISVGGFLGIGERHVAVDPASVVITRQGNDLRAVVNTTRDDLKNAPEFKFEGPMTRN
jgi:sporulation protein YlmC with PRC-barrel domain